MADHMTCPYCGKRLQDGEVICPVCGTEVVTVPEYHSVEVMLERQNLRTLKQQEAEQINLEKKKKRIQENQLQKKRRRRRRLIASLFLVVLTAVLILTAVRFYIDSRHAGSFDYQYSRAQELFSEGSMAEAELCIRQALTLDGSSIAAKRLYAQILTAESKTDDAAAVYRELISREKNLDDYRTLIAIYDKQGNTAAIQELLKTAPASVRKIFYAYLPVTPVFVTPEGNYDSPVSVTIRAGEHDTIRYTLDGSDPDENSPVYEAALTLGEGRTEIRAAAFSEKGVQSQVMIAVYNINLSQPATPVIEQESGEYWSGSTISVRVPEDCTAYYAFDETPDENSTRYTGPVAMPEGTHIFSVILVNQYGKHSAPASETYIVQP